VRVNQEIPHTLWKPTTHHRVYIRWPLVLVLSQSNNFHFVLCYFPTIHYNIIPLSMARSS